MEQFVSKRSYQENLFKMEFWKSDCANICMERGKVIGQGGFGCIYRGLWENRPAAIKRIFLGDSNRMEMGLVRLRHENIIQYYDKVEDDDFVYIAMELCEANLEQHIRGSYEGPTPGTMIEMMEQVTLGLKYLHVNKILHSDVKPQNILISIPNGSKPKMKLADFGHCMQMDDKGETIIPWRGPSSLGWQPPEAYCEYERSFIISYPLDVFSLGCVFGYSFTGGSHPFGSPIYRKYNIFENRLDWKNEDDVTAPLKQMVKKMVQFEPCNRPSLDCILNLLQRQTLLESNLNNKETSDHPIKQNGRIEMDKHKGRPSLNVVTQDQKNLSESVEQESLTDSIHSLIQEVDKKRDSYSHRGGITVLQQRQVIAT